jgi:uncharacterized protein YaiE (UPF0345 family)
MIAVNEYFDGAVKSLGYESKGKSSVGVILPGEYEFGTAAPETMLVIEGEMDVKLADELKWTLYAAGQKFEVAANSSFKVKVAIPTSYLCKYK